jgi:hypothetical protein
MRCLACSEEGLELNGNRRCASCEEKINIWIETKEIEGKRGPDIDTIVDYHLSSEFINDLIGRLTYE